MTDDYLSKNRGFITSHKLKEFMRCPRCYYLKYVEEVPDPTESDEFLDKEALLIGQATDDLLTLGDEKFNESYEVVARRSKTAEKTQLTNTHFRTIQACANEFKEQPLFRQAPKKEVLTWDYAGFKLKAELDDLDLEAKMIRDIKTAANVLTFEPDYYIHQFSFYQWGVEEIHGEKCEAMLEIVDKYKYFSRSKCVVYLKSTLEGYRGQILNALAKLKFAQATNSYLATKNQDELYKCPYYKDHGRPNEILYY